MLIFKLRDIAAVSSNKEDAVRRYRAQIGAKLDETTFVRVFAREIDVLAKYVQR